MAYGARNGLGLVVAGVIAAWGCAQGTVEFDDEGKAGGGSGGTGGMAGGGGVMSPCGVVCSEVVEAPDCHIAICNEDTEKCVIVPGENGSTCDDGQFCTSSDACSEGECVGGPPTTCDDMAEVCSVPVCDEENDVCGQTPSPNGTFCQSDNLCYTGSTCSNGFCIGGIFNTCSGTPAPACHSAQCNGATGNCDTMPDPALNGTSCTDLSQPCTVNMTCLTGVCQGGSPKDCSGLSVGCNLGTCDLATGNCVAMPLMSGDPCDDQNTCTSGETCASGTCAGGVSIVTCTNGDLCCPASCDETNDDDCGNDVIIVAASPYSSDVFTKLSGLGVFPVVTLFDARSNTPTMADLQAHNVALVFSDSGFADPTLLGDRLADYYDGGGRVVLATFAMCTGIVVAGRFGDPLQGYLLLDPQVQSQPFDSLGTVFEPLSPLMTGVTTLTATSAYRCTGTPINGGVVVAQWSSLASPLVVRGTVGGRNRADLNFYPPSIDIRSDFWSGDGLALMRNALLYK